MNIAFFLIPKAEVVYLHTDSNMRQALEKLERHRFTAIPLVDKAGKYAGTLTEGDLLWKIKNTFQFMFSRAERIKISDVPRRIQNKPVHIDAEMEDLLSLAIAQNFVPVVDDHEIFIGIIRRREIIEYYANEKDPRLKQRIS